MSPWNNPAAMQHEEQLRHLHQHVSLPPEVEEKLLQLLKRQADELIDFSQDHKLGGSKMIGVIMSMLAVYSSTFGAIIGSFLREPLWAPTAEWVSDCIGKFTLKACHDVQDFIRKEKENK